ncbi:MAG: VWA domain-containing protein [Acidobacteria bacterium]|nr:VWA domain-containing protein [Acidobacteriota bacterium]
MSSGRSLRTAALLAAIGLSSPAFATEPHRIKAEPSRVEVTLVLLDVIVTDKKGVPVTDLGPTDFQLLVDNTLSPIEAVESHCSAPGESTAALDAPPRYLVLFFDMSHLLAPARLRSIKAGIQFIDEMMSARDQVMVVAFAKGLHIVSRFTGERAILKSRMEAMIDDHDLIDSAPFEEENTLARFDRGTGGARRRASPMTIGGPSPSLNEFAGECQAEARQAEIDATRTVRAMANTMEAFEGIPGRKAMVLMSETLRSNPGGTFYTACGQSSLLDNSSLHLTVLPEIDDLVRRANLAGISFYPVHPGGISAGATSLAMEGALDFQHSIALSTGGQAFILMNKPLLPFAQAEADLSCNYVLAYRPPEGFREGRHPVTVHVARKGVKVRHRDSFVISKPGEASDRQMMAVLSSPGLYRDLKVESHAYSLLTPQPGKRRILIQASVPLSELTLLPTSDAVSRGSLLLRGGIISPHGRLLCDFKEAIAFEAGPRTVAETSRAGIQAACDVEEGENEIVVAARDETGGSLGAFWGTFAFRPGDEGHTPRMLLWGPSRGDVWVRHDEKAWLPSLAGNDGPESETPLLLRPVPTLAADEPAALTCLVCGDEGVGEKDWRALPASASIALSGPLSFSLPARVIPGGARCGWLQAELSAGSLTPGAYVVRPEPPAPFRGGATSRLVVSDAGGAEP